MSFGQDKPNEFLDNGLRFSCTRCGECCTRHDEHAYVYVNEGERAALAGHLGLSVADFEAEYCQEDDGWMVLRMDERCPFLSEEGACRVYPVRPTQCATWPFWRENLNPTTWREVVARICPGIDRGRLHSREEIEARARENEAAAES